MGLARRDDEVAGLELALLGTEPRHPELRSRLIDGAARSASAPQAKGKANNMCFLVLLPFLRAELLLLLFVRRWWGRPVG